MQTILSNPLDSLGTCYLVSQDPQEKSLGKIPVSAPFRIGRREGFDLCLSSRHVSGLHAEILEDNGALWVDDLNSTNGTFVNGERIRTRTQLKHNDVIQFGEPTFTFVSAGGAGRFPEATICRDADTAIPESSEERFQRLLREGVVPNFQPIFNISGNSRQLVGFEVLGRSRLFGLSTPDQMFAAATDLEMEAELSRVLRLRGIEVAESDLPADMTLFVNTHPAELDCGKLEESIREIRNLYKSRPIMMELPEKVLYAPESFKDLRNMLRELNIQLVIHDFGAGQIRLAELNEIAPDVVKFDCALIQGIDRADEKRKRLVAAMAKMCIELGITPMAEYIETEEEHNALKDFGFELVQGFHYGHPKPLETKEDSASGSEPSIKGLMLPTRCESPIKLKSSSDDDVSDQLDKFQRLIDSSENIFGASQVQIGSPSLSEKPTPKDEQWLLKQSEDHFAIQLMLSSKRSQAESFVAKQTQPKNYAIYRKIGRTREWYVVVYGAFEERDAAKQATEKFDSDTVSTWVRSIAAIQRDINVVLERKSENVDGN